MIYIKSKLNESRKKINYALLTLFSFVYGFIISGIFYVNPKQFLFGGVFCSVCAFIGYVLGKLMRNYVGNAYLSSDNSVYGAFHEKVRHQYGTQWTNFFLFGACPYMLIHIMIYGAENI